MHVSGAAIICNQCLLLGGLGLIHLHETQHKIGRGNYLGEKLPNAQITGISVGERRLNCRLGETVFDRQVGRSQLGNSLSLRKGFMVWRTASHTRSHLTISIWGITNRHWERLLRNWSRASAWRRWKLSLGYRDYNFLALTLQFTGHVAKAF